MAPGASCTAFLEDLKRRGQADPITGQSERCRRLAETRYSVELGVDAYHQLYDELTAGITVMDCERGGVS